MFAEMFMNERKRVPENREILGIRTECAFVDFLKSALVDFPTKTLQDGLKFRSAFDLLKMRIVCE